MAALISQDRLRYAGPAIPNRAEIRKEALFEERLLPALY
jgi:hypothetical protein